MAEEKKKGFFQRIKSAFLGEKEDETVINQELTTTPDLPVQSEQPEEKPAGLEKGILFEKDSEIVEPINQNSPAPELNVKLQIGKGHISSEINPKTGILFENETADTQEIEEEKKAPEEVVKKRATSELMLDLASQESPLKGYDASKLEEVDLNPLLKLENKPVEDFDDNSLASMLGIDESINQDNQDNQAKNIEAVKNDLANIFGSQLTPTEIKHATEVLPEVSHEPDKQPEISNQNTKKEAEEKIEKKEPRSLNIKSLDISDITNKKKKEETPAEIITESVEEKVEEAKEENKEPEKKGWFSKVVDTLNSPIEIKLQAPEGDDSLMGKLKGNISIGLGKPVVKETDEEREIWRQKLRERLAGTRQAFTEKLERVMHGRTKIDDELLEEIEDILLESDVGVEMTDKISAKLRELAKEKRFLPSEVMPSLFDYLKSELSMEEERIIIDESRLNVILMVGVNGTGKTTTTGKIAAKLSISEYSVILAAADTFRAAAIEQLEVWSHRANVPLIKHQENSDAAAVVYDAIKAAKARKANVLLIDTAGRLHNKAHLMDELKKIRRIIDKEDPDAKVEVLLVLDATTGQNGLSQALIFKEAVNLTGVVLTKLDGTAKGGVIFAIKNTLNLPIKLVGVGESLDDLRDFQPQIFIDALFSEKSENLIEESTKMRS